MENCYKLIIDQKLCKNKGLISVDHSNKTTLPLTIPRSIFKSSTKDLFLATSKLYMFGVRGLSPTITLFHVLKFYFKQVSICAANVF